MRAGWLPLPLECRIHRRDIRAIAHRIRGRKRRGNFLSYASRCHPFRSALERGDEADTTEGRDVVPERRMEDPSLAIAEHHQHRLLAAGALIAGIRVRTREIR